MCQRNGYAAQERDAVVGAINFLFDDGKLVGGSNFSILGILGQFSWVVVVIAATVALSRAGLSSLVVEATLLAGLFASHAGYGAAAGLVALLIAELLRFGTPRGEVAFRRTPSPA